MNKDIRLCTTFPRHPKTIKLKRILGTWEPIVVLWLWAAENRPSGDLSGLEIEDVAIAANWEGECKVLLDALLSVKFLKEINKGAYILHGWDEHNAYAANAEKRSEKARLAAKARWDKRLGSCLGDAKNNGKHAQSNAPSPSPSPSPSLKGQASSLPLNGILSEIQKVADALYESKKFLKAHVFKNKQLKLKKNPEAILHTLIRASMKKSFPKGGAWGYCQNIIKVENGNFNERQSVAEAEKRKAEDKKFAEKLKGDRGAKNAS